MQNIKKVLIAIIIATVATTLNLVGVTQAQASVWGCQNGFSAAGAYSYCSLGDSQYFRTNVLCQNWITKSSYVKSGTWKRVNGGSPSTVGGCGNIFEGYYGTPWATSK